MWPFKKKQTEEKVEFPYHYARIVWTEAAIHDSVFDDYNKEIQIIKGGEIFQKIPYTIIDKEAIETVLKIPIRDMTKEKSEEKFEFETMDSLTGTFSEVRN
jgi:hypothetical protein